MFTGFGQLNPEIPVPQPFYPRSTQIHAGSAGDQRGLRRFRAHRAHRASTWRPRGLSKWVISSVVSTLNGVTLIISLHRTDLLRPLARGAARGAAEGFGAFSSSQCMGAFRFQAVFLWLDLWDAKTVLLGRKNNLKTT